MSRFLLVVTFLFLTACGSRGQAGPGDKLSSEPADSGEAKIYTHRLPKDMEPKQVSRLEVILEAVSPPPGESYYVDLFALQAPTEKNEKPRWLPLGGRLVFKPLLKGETTSIFLNSPPKEAWLSSVTGEELRVAVQIKAVRPERPVPDVKLDIVDVKESTDKKQ